MWCNNYIEYESNVDKSKLKDLINNLKKPDTWKIHLIIPINFISSKDNDKESVMHSKSDNMVIMINGKGDEVIEKLFESLLSRYQIRLETLMRGSDFIFDCVHLSYYKCHKDWIKSKKATTNPINKKDNKCFQYTVTVTLNHKEITKESQGITKIKPFIDKYN